MLINSKGYEILKNRLAASEDRVYEDIRNGKYLSNLEYDAFVSATHERRIAWWRAARFGLFIHYGIFSARKNGEWELAWDATPPSEYEQSVDSLNYRSGQAEEWVRLAKEAGAKYVVLTTRHHEGFSLWDSEVNPYNSVNYGPHIDIVREFVDACRKHGMRIGFYSSLMDWHHPDCGKSLSDPAARQRFLDYTYALNAELLTKYGKIDILWYDMSFPLQGEVGWVSHILNQRLRALQPDILINNRSGSVEDYGTPEAHLEAMETDWETCDKVNCFSWGYIDEAQTQPWMKTPQQIIHDLAFCACNRGNYLLNIGPRADGSVADNEVATLRAVGKWLSANGEAIYGEMNPCHGLVGGTAYGLYGGNMLSFLTASANRVYLFEPIWPKGKLSVAGYACAPRRVYLLNSGEELPFTYENFRLLIQTPEEIPDKVLGISVVVLEFDGEIPEYRFCGAYPHINDGNQRYSV